MQDNSVWRTRRLIGWLVLALVSGAAVSLVANLENVGSQYEELATEIGRRFFQALTTMRDWNFRHQGVYVPISGDVQPNPDLIDAARDITSTSGLRLTKINHSQMTRMIAEMLDRANSVHVHITGLTPIRSQNAPDDWESSALKAFVANAQEVHALQRDKAGETRFRYMAPLRAEKSCLSCHHENGSTSDIMGGISVSFSFAPYQRLMDQSNRRIWMLHLVGLLASLIPIAFLGTGLVRNVTALQASLLRVRQLEGLVPICANCKKIRTEGADADEQMSWVPVERYIEDRTNAEFTHGLCPECRRTLYPGLTMSKRK